MTKELYVVIATAGRPTMLNKTLDSLVACIKPEIYRGTIVIENGPPMGVEMIVHTYAESLNAKYMHVELPNKSNALNQVLSSIETGLIFFTDDDVRVEPNLLVTYAKAAEGIEQGQFYGGPTMVDYEQQPSEWLMPLLPPSARGLTMERLLSDKKNPWFLGFNWAAFAQDLRAVGGFDPMLGPGSPIEVTVDDETELQRRLTAAGIVPVPLEDAVVWHYVPAARITLKWIRQRAYRHGLASGIRAAKRQGRSSLLLVVTRGFLKQCLLLTVNGVLFKKANAAQALTGIAFRIGQLHGATRKISMTEKHLVSREFAL